MVTQFGARSLSEAEHSFVRILKNESKFDKSATQPVRTRGFVVMVRGTHNLKPLQTLCTNQVVSARNSCLTARYRLQPQAGLGTLLIAFVSDLYKLRQASLDDRSSKSNTVSEAELAPESGETRRGNITGDLEPSALIAGELARASWMPLISKYIDRILESNTEPRAWPSDLANRSKESTLFGTIEEGQLRNLFAAFDDESSILRSGDRLVLFGEFSEQATNADEWSSSLNILLKYLPERVGMVFSGAPPDLRLDLPRDDPHFVELTVPAEAESPTPTQFTYRYVDSSFHSDVPADKDELSVNAYANAIARFVLHPQTKPPLTIGIHGRWGKGKSSFMKLIDSALIKYAESNRANNTQQWNDVVAKLLQAESDRAGANAQIEEKEMQSQQHEYERLREQEQALWQEMTEQAKKNVLSVRFNAWQFEDAKQTWAGLASEISERLEEVLPRHSRQWLKLRYAWKERRTELFLNVLLPLAIFSVVAILFAFGFFRGITAADPDSPLGALLKLLVPGGTLLTLWYLSSRFVKVAQPISERVLTYVAMPNYREQMGFQHRVKDDLKFVYDFVATRLNRSFNRAGPFRVVVYIDDLDRCSETKIMELLQAINLILADCEFFVFVGMDTEMIYRAINSYYKEKSNDRLADDCLSKIIQISFHLPETKVDTRVSYLSTLFSLSSRLELAERVHADGNQPTTVTRPTNEEASIGGGLPYDLSQLLAIVPVQIKETEDTSHELEAFSDYCGFIDDNPREIKRLINIHRLIKILVQKPNAPLDADRQKKLVKWLIFCDTWPHLVGHVLQLTTYSDTENCLLDLVNLLEEARKKPQSTEAVPQFDRLGEFATFLPTQHERDTDKSAHVGEWWDKKIAHERRVYTLSASDIDDDFRLAANLSLMIRKPAQRG
ncbi:MAG TPA: P-loop NTPase fold protein [Pyrinomonadaceae bacterium]